MERVAYLFNNVGSDKESQLELGDIKFQVKGRVEEGRINKTNYISIVTIPIETKYINSRTIDGSIGYGYYIRIMSCLMLYLTCLVR